MYNTLNNNLYIDLSDFIYTAKNNKKYYVNVTDKGSHSKWHIFIDNSTNIKYASNNVWYDSFNNNYKINNLQLHKVCNNKNELSDDIIILNDINLLNSKLMKNI